MRCPHCGTEVPAGVRFCPWCEESLTALPRERPAAADDIPEDPEMAAESPHLPRMQRIGVWMLLVVLVYVAVVTIGAIYTRAHVPVTIHPRLTAAQGALTLTNGDAFPWTHVQLGINAGSAGMYLRPAGAIQPGETITIRPAEFTNNAGARFDPTTHKGVNFSVRCDTPQGKAAWFGGLFGLRLKN
ncbi:MAG TPA: zinc ribbon domain-containing protein [Armatimonadota bacterium]